LYFALQRTAMTPAILLRTKHVGFCFLFVLLCSSYAQAQLQPPLADSFLTFIKANPNRASVYITRNDTVITHLNENSLMPLASTFTILVAIEFAQQSAHETINENGYVNLEDLEKFQMEDSTSNADSLWRAYLKAHNEIKNGSVKLVDVARGMIMFGCNANADYLMDILGFDNVKDNIELFKLKQHTAIFPLAGSMFLYQVPKKSSEDKLVKSLSKYSVKTYSMESYYNHMDLKEDSTFKATFKPEQFTINLKKMWSEKLPASTTKDYVEIAQVLNNRGLIHEDAYFSIAEMLEYPMENKAYQIKYKHYGAKTGTSTTVFTYVFYFTAKDGTKMETAIFFHNLWPTEVKRLEQWAPSFTEQLIADPLFRYNVRF
jgi:D-alanyl-D-alanine carboxypeptidase